MAYQQPDRLAGILELDERRAARHRPLPARAVGQAAHLHLLDRAPERRLSACSSCRCCSTRCSAGCARRQGSSSLRAILYMDEIAGYIPPVAMPPSKAPLLTLMKQARAYGLGVVLATQNPADLDYKGLSNAGTWFLGRLQTERDKARVIDGLEGVGGDSGARFDRAQLERTLSALGQPSLPHEQRARGRARDIPDAVGALVPARSTVTPGHQAAHGRPDDSRCGAGAAPENIGPARPPSTRRTGQLRNRAPRRRSPRTSGRSCRPRFRSTSLRSVPVPHRPTCRCSSAARRFATPTPRRRSIVMDDVLVVTPIVEGPATIDWMSARDAGLRAERARRSSGRGCDDLSRCRRPRARRQELRRLVEGLRRVAREKPQVVAVLLRCPEDDVAASAKTSAASGSGCSRRHGNGATRPSNSSGGSTRRRSRRFRTASGPRSRRWRASPSR